MNGRKSSKKGRYIKKRTTMKTRISINRRHHPEPAKNRQPNENNSPHHSARTWEEYLTKARERFLQRFNQPIHAVPGMMINNFEIIRTVGTGWYGRVVLARNRKYNSFHAVKIIDKTAAVRLDQVEHLFNERRVLQAVDFPFMIRMQFYFKDNSNLYFVMPFVVGGELFTYLRKEGRFNESRARFFSAQVILALEYLHASRVVYRDLKPENVLLDIDGYLKITDFGFSKMLHGRTYTICGTPEYLAPEMLRTMGYVETVDWWSLGVLVYEMCAGYSPFYSNNPNAENLLERIAKGTFAFPAYFSKGLREVCRGLMEVEVWRRLGGPGVRALGWFTGISWMSLLHKELPPPILPVYSSDFDASNYDTFDEIPIHIHANEQHRDAFLNF